MSLRTRQAWRPKPSKRAPGPGVGLEPSERPVELVAIGDPSRIVVGGRFEDGLDADLDHPPLAAPDEIDAGPDHEAVEPVVERRGVTQPRQAAPGPDERLLDGILGQLRVAEDEPGGGVQARAGGADEIGEGVPVALPRSVHESDLVHDRPSGVGATNAIALASLRRSRTLGGSNFPSPRTTRPGELSFAAWFETP